MKKVVRLNEKDIESLVKRIVKESNEIVGESQDWDETGFENSLYPSEGEYLDSLSTTDKSDVYLSLHYSTGEEDYGDGENSDYVEGRIMTHIPRKRFIEIMGKEPESITEIDIYSDSGTELLDLMVRKAYVSYNTQNGNKMKPEIQYGWTQGVIVIISKDEYDRVYNTRNGLWWSSSQRGGNKK